MPPRHPTARPLPCLPPAPRRRPRLAWPGLRRDRGRSSPRSQESLPDPDCRTARARDVRRRRIPSQPHAPRRIRGRCHVESVIPPKSPRGIQPRQLGSRRRVGTGETCQIRALPRCRIRLISFVVCSEGNTGHPDRRRHSGSTLHPTQRNANAHSHQHRLHVLRRGGRKTPAANPSTATAAGPSRASTSSPRRTRSKGRSSWSRPPS